MFALLNYTIIFRIILIKNITMKKIFTSQTKFLGAYLLLLITSIGAQAQTYFNTDVTMVGPVTWYDNTNSITVDALGAVQMKDTSLYISGPANLTFEIKNDGVWNGTTASTHIFQATVDTTDRATMWQWNEGHAPSFFNVTLEGNRQTKVPTDLDVKGTLSTLATSLAETNHILKVGGDLTHNGALILLSNATKTAQFDTFTGAKSGSGTVEIHRHIPARRAFRFLSSAVTTSGSMSDNWQEGGRITAIGGVSNLVPGFGTHITGVGDGFDVQPSTNPSAFVFDNTAASWSAISNTTDAIQAAKPYRINVRGDRSLDISSNTAVATPTILRTTGSVANLITGTTNANATLNAAAGAFSFVGNPYPAQVNLVNVVAASTNINTGLAYIWDPNLGGAANSNATSTQLGGRGGWVTVTLPAGTNGQSSPQNQYLQPGQAVFLVTNAAGAASASFEETHKAVSQIQTAVFNVPSQINILVYDAPSFTSGDTPDDGIVVRFSSEYSNEVDSFDAINFTNPDETLAINNNGNLLSLESRNFPEIDEEIQLSLTRYRTTDYVFDARITELYGVTAYLVDNYLETFNELSNNESTLYSFSVNPSIPASIDANRFKIVFDQETLTDEDNQFGSNFSLFPNPATSSFTIATRGIEGDKVSVSVANALGQVLFSKSLNVASNGLINVDVNSFATGVYVVTLQSSNGAKFISKLLKK